MKAHELIMKQKNSQVSVNRVRILKESGLNKLSNK